MTVQVKITRKGCFNQKGQPIPVGTVLTFPREPKGWANKYVLVSDATPAPEQEMQTGGEEDKVPEQEVKDPAPEGTGETETDDDTDEEEEGNYDPLEPLRQRYRDLTGNEPDKRWGYPKLTAEIAELEEDESEEGAD